MTGQVKFSLSISKNLSLGSPHVHLFVCSLLSCVFHSGPQPRVWGDAPGLSVGSGRDDRVTRSSMLWNNSGQLKYLYDAIIS